MNELFTVLAQCKVKTFKKYTGNGLQYVCHAIPLEPVPEIMMNHEESKYCWIKDHWEFPDFYLPKGLTSVFNTWVHTGIDTWSESICLLRLQNRGFSFEKYDFSLMESGSGI